MTPQQMESCSWQLAVWKQNLACSVPAYSMSCPHLSATLLTWARASLSGSSLLLATDQAPLARCSPPSTPLCGRSQGGSACTQAPFGPRIPDVCTRPQHLASAEGLVSTFNFPSGETCAKLNASHSDCSSLRTWRNDPRSSR